MERLCYETGYEEPRYLYTLSLVYAGLMRVDDAISVAEKARSIAAASDEPAHLELARGIGVSLRQYELQKEQGFDIKRRLSQPPDVPSEDDAADANAPTTRKKEE